MEHRFYVHPFNCVLSLICCVCFALLGFTLVPLGRWGSVAVFGVLALVFAGVAAFCGAVIHLSSEGVSRTILGIKTLHLRWEQIAEVGVAGSKVFNRNHPEKTGTLYIYFSEQPLTEQSRFDLMLKWPPMNKMYLVYNKKRINAIQLLWSSTIETYNVGKLAL